MRFYQILLILVSFAGTQLEAKEASAQALVSPFHGTATLSNVFDHTSPYFPIDSNSRLTACDGEATFGIQGHNGLDWNLPLGTPIRSVANGVVVFIGSERPWYCPLLGRTVSGKYITTEHSIYVGSKLERIRVNYLHLDSFSNLQVGSYVQAGQIIGRSGNTGCSTAPHLHLSVFKFISGVLVGGEWLPIDPFGWHSTSSGSPYTISSRDLWHTTDRPSARREVVFPTTSFRGVKIRSISFMGKNDLDPLELNKDEFIDLEFRPESASSPIDASRVIIRFGSRERIVLNLGRIDSSRTIRIHTGSGTSTSLRRHLGYDTPLLPNIGECVSVLVSGTTFQDSKSYGTSVCN